MVTMAQSAAAANWCTLPWIARSHSHTYINTVATTWCEAMTLRVCVLRCLLQESQGNPRCSIRSRSPSPGRNRQPVLSGAQLKRPTPEPQGKPAS